jgi:hypothetical protein
MCIHWLAAWIEKRTNINFSTALRTRKKHRTTNLSCDGQFNGGGVTAGETETEQQQTQLDQLRWQAREDDVALDVTRTLSCPAVNPSSHSHCETWPEHASRRPPSPIAVGPQWACSSAPSSSLPLILDQGFLSWRDFQNFIENQFYHW